MPHVIVKLWAGRSDTEKANLADAIARALIDTIGSSEKSISVSIEDYAPAAWTEQVYKPDILARPATLYRKPGYAPD